MVEQLLLGLSTYLGTQLFKMASWNKWLAFLFSLIVAVGVSYFTAAGKDAESIFSQSFQVATTSSFLWGAGKVLGIGAALQVNLLGRIGAAFAGTKGATTQGGQPSGH